MPKVYTKVGDGGSSGLLGGEKISKSDLRLQAYGTIDELNSGLGLCAAAILENGLEAIRHAGKSSGGPAGVLEPVARDLIQVQHWLFDLGALLATPPALREKYKLAMILPGHIQWMEEHIDQMDAVMPPLNAFILPGGHLVSSHLQVIRSVARRAEREIVSLHEKIPNYVPEQVIPFINRLSDYLFVTARFVNYLSGVREVTWAKGSSA